MKNNFFRVWVFIALSVFFFVPEIMWAAGLVPCGSGTTACTLCDLIVGFSNLTTYLLKLLVTISLAGLFFAGVMYMISAGDDGMMTSAKNFAKACLIGFAVVLGAWLIVNVTLTVISADFTELNHTSWYKFSCNYNTAP